MARVRPEVIAARKLPRRLVGKHPWDERHLGRDGVVIRRFFLHVSGGEQKRHVLERLDEPETHRNVSARRAGARAAAQ